MAIEEKFEFTEFVSTLKGTARDEQRRRVDAEIARVSAILVRDPGRKFQQQLYVKRLDRLSRFLSGKDVKDELTPSELQAYEMLGLEAPGARAAAAAAAPPAPGRIPTDERRKSRRIYMKTKVAIRREGGPAVEVLEPSNVSRGGIGFYSTGRYALHATIFVNMHYRPDDPDAKGLETRAMVVRAAPVPQSASYSYGVKFLSE